MPGQPTEQAFEAAIEHHPTVAGGCLQGDRDGFDLDRACSRPMCWCSSIRNEEAAEQAEESART